MSFYCRFCLFSGADTGVKPARWAEDANVLASLIRRSFDSVGLQAPPLIGPDHYSLEGYKEVLGALKKDTLSAVTYHDYPQCETGQPIVLAMLCALL